MAVRKPRKPKHLESMPADSRMKQIGDVRKKSLDSRLGREARGLGNRNVELLRFPDVEPYHSEWMSWIRDFKRRYGIRSGDSVSFAREKKGKQVSGFLMTQSSTDKSYKTIEISNSKIIRDLKYFSELNDWVYHEMMTTGRLPDPEQ